MAHYNSLIFDFGEQPPSIVFLTFPSLKSSGMGDLFCYGDSSVTFPKLKITADACGITATFPSLILTTGFYTDPSKTVLPKFTVTASGETIRSNASINLPMLQVSGSAITGEVGSAYLGFPSLNVYSKGPEVGTVSITLPKLSVDGIILPSSVGSVSVKLPFISLFSEGIAGGTGFFDIDFVHLGIDASGITGRVSEGNLLFVSLGIDGSGFTGRVGYSFITVPHFIVASNGYSYQNVIGDINTILPLFDLYGSGYIIPVELWKTYVLNMKNRALSRYESYNFNSFTKFNNVYLGANSNGIFVLTGNVDNGASISSVVLTGMIGGNSDALKRMIDVIISMKGNGLYELTIKSDDGTEYVYPITKNNPLLTAIKTKLGRGLKGKYWTCKFSNVGGSDFEIDQINADIEILQKRYLI